MIVRLTAYSRTPADPLEDAELLFTRDHEVFALPSVGDWLDSADFDDPEWEIYRVKAVFHHSREYPRKVTGMRTIDGMEPWVEIILEPR